MQETINPLCLVSRLFLYHFSNHLVPFPSLPFSLSCSASCTVSKYHHATIPNIVNPPVQGQFHYSMGFTQLLTDIKPQIREPPSANQILIRDVQPIGGACNFISGFVVYLALCTPCKWIFRTCRTKTEWG
jgi:hypothetical protein